MLRLYKCMAALMLLLFASASWAQVVVEISGGGTDKLVEAMTANALTGGTIRITDSATYTETYDMYVGPAYSANGRLGFNIEAAEGTSPTVVLDGCGIVAYASSGDFHIGSADGGRITIDATNAAVAGSTAMAWYIASENGAPAGAASVATFENLDVVLGATQTGWSIGSGIDDLSGLTNPTINIDDVTVTGGSIQLHMSSSQPNGPCIVNVDNSRFFEAAPKAVQVDGGMGPEKELNISNSIIYSSYNTMEPTIVDTGLFLTYGAQMNIDHCDLVAPNCPRVLYAIFGAGYTVTNSIVHGAIHGAQTIANTQACTMQYCNTGSSDAPFTDLGGNLIEWPAYVSMGTDLNNSSNFAVLAGSQSRTADVNGEPLGSRGTSVTGLNYYHLSGGGTNLISAAITANPGGCVIVLDDSLTYTENQDLYLGYPGSAETGRHSFDLIAAAGQTPKVVLDGAGVVAYASSADFTLGSADGGRISIDARNAKITGATPIAFWYIGFENALTGAACRMTMENLEIDLRGAENGVTFGCVANDETYALTTPTLVVSDVTFKGGRDQIRASYAPNGRGSEVLIQDCIFLEYETYQYSGASVVLNKDLVGSDNSKVSILDSIFYKSDASPASSTNEANTILAYGGQLTVDHCDVINEATSSAGSRAIAAADPKLVVGTSTLAKPVVRVSNSIIRAKHAGVIGWNVNEDEAWLIDCNVSVMPADETQLLPAVVFSGFSVDNVIEEEVAPDEFNYGEWPVYVAYGADPSVEQYFVVEDTTQSATFGNDAPLGSQGTNHVNAVNHWELY